MTPFDNRKQVAGFHQAVPESTKGLVNGHAHGYRNHQLSLLLILEPVYLGKFQSKDGSCCFIFTKSTFILTKQKVCDLQTNVTLITNT